jgi:peptidoglycan/LPS O-acetylase OafA/YrhL
VLFSIARDAGSMLMHAHGGCIDHLHRAIMSGGQRFHDPLRCLEIDGQANMQADRALLDNNPKLLIEADLHRRRVAPPRLILSLAPCCAAPPHWVNKFSRTGQTYRPRRRQNMTASVNRKYMPEIDQIRAFAALLVLFYHGLQLIGARLAHGVAFDQSLWLYSSNPLISIIEEGHTAVALFIVLSGFILSLGAVGNTVRYGPFLVARILRIYPLLIVFAIVATSITPSNMLSFLATVLPFNLPDGRIANDFTYMFWAVAIEFQCYLIFPFLIAFSNQQGSTILLRIILVAIVARALAVFVDAANARDISYWTVLGRIDQFCIGIIAARFYVGRKLSAGWFLPAGLAAALMLCLFNYAGGWPTTDAWKIVWPTIEGGIWACFIVTYIAAGRLLPYPISWAGAKLGEISYSTYLIHFVVLSAIIKYELYVHLTGDGYYDALITTFLVALPLTVCIGVLTYSTIELPFLRIRPKYIDRPITEARSLGKS